jgi:hypothetical protein
MSDLKSAAKQALEAMNAMMTHMGMDEDEWNKVTFDQMRKAITSLRQAIAEAEKQEPYVDVVSHWHYWMAEADKFRLQLENLRQAIAEAEKQPTGPATSADRYFYEAGFEEGRQQGMKQERALWELARIGQEIEAEAEKQEPVAWGMEGKDGFIFDVICPAEHEREEGGYTTPLYTTPQQRTWVGLTDEEVKKIAYNNIEVKVARAIEAKLKEKNTQPAQPKREPLTDEEIAEICLGLYGSGIHHDDYVFVRAIEAAHGIIKTYHEKDKT